MDLAYFTILVGRNPHPSGSAKLEGAEDLWRIRVRQYRLIYQILDEQVTVVIVKIGDRKDAYR